MAGEDEYTFHIEAFSPETIPMQRLAEYMRALAVILGETKSVHFVRLDSGSTGVVHRVEREASPKVRNRLAIVGTPEAPREANDAYQAINDWLQDDNAVGELRLENSNVLKFPGRERVRPQKVLPFNQSAEFDGILVRIGGKDDTAHAQIQDSDGRSMRCEVSRELAKTMAHHLFGTPLRVIGKARWQRHENGEWELLSFKVSEFKILDNDEVGTVIARIRLVRGKEQNADAAVLMQSLRQDEGEMH